MTGTIRGVGLGPGDPELMSVRADRLVRGARNVAFFRKEGRPGRAREMVEGMLHPDATEIAMEYPVTTELPFDGAPYRETLAAYYAAAAARLTSLADAGEDVVVLCEGDPFFYGSFMHLHSRLNVPVEVVPGITGMSGAWTATGRPVTWGDDVLTVLMATVSEDELVRRMRNTDALVVMKLGRNLDKVRRALVTAGRHDEAWLVECATMPGQRVAPLAKVKAAVPYFSLIVVHGQGRRP
jgi:precorrin-2/cobalt-factor-2 C20-methyltransferase